MIEKIKNLSVGIKLFILMIVIYLVIGLVNYSFFVKILISSYKNLIGIIPVLLLTFLIVFIINYFIKPEIIKKHLGNSSGIKGWLYVLLGSIFISGPPFTIFPILKELKGHGMNIRYWLLF